MTITRGKRMESRAEASTSAIVPDEKSLLGILKDIMVKLESCYSLIEEQNKKIEDLKTEIIQLKGKEDSNPVKSYSEVTKNKPEHVLVVKPKKEQTIGIDKVKQDLKTNVNPADLQVGINIGKTVKDGGILVKCADAQDLNTIKNSIQHKMGNNYEVKIPKKFYPKIIIIGIVDENENKEELTNKIVKQNKIPMGDNSLFKPIHKTKTKNERVNLIIETDPNTFKWIMSNNSEGKASLHVGWKDCYVYEHFNVYRCFKCCGYNHGAEQCSESVTCPLCAGNHKKNECNTEERKCINCVRVNKKLNLGLDVSHSSVDRNCRCYSKTLESIQRKISYEM